VAAEALDRLPQHQVRPETGDQSSLP
jgi:hypothetical protein